MPTYTIKRRDGGGVIAEREADNLRKAIAWCVHNRSDLRGADLRGADLTGACLRGAYLTGTYLTGACLRGVDLNWQSHALLAEILRREAGQDVPRRRLVGLIAISTDWCWDDFLQIDDAERDWALDILAAYVQSDDEAPDVLRERKVPAEGGDDAH